MMNIRPADADDESQLLRLVGLFPTTKPVASPAFRAAFHAKLGDPRSYLAVAEQGPDLQGCVGGYCHPALYAAGSTAWVDELLVEPAARGHGVGRALMLAFERWAESKGCALVSLATRNAGRFYERLGYESTAAYYKKYFRVRT